MALLAFTTSMGRRTVMFSGFLYKTGWQLLDRFIKDVGVVSRPFLRSRLKEDKRRCFSTCSGNSFRFYLIFAVSGISAHNRKWGKTMYLKSPRIIVRDYRLPYNRVISGTEIIPERRRACQNRCTSG